METMKLFYNLLLIVTGLVFTFGLTGCAPYQHGVKVINECPGSHYDKDCYVPARRGITEDQLAQEGNDTQALIQLLRRKNVRVDDATLAIRIRGAQGDPLFVIDGVPTMLSSRDFFMQVSVADIESVSVLKGADAAMYGSRGGNGVIVVRTKS